MITILTPTFNRELLIERLAESLNSQTDHDFEWLIIDDGSTDNTRELIKEFSCSSSFPIRYVYKENGGKHTALNLGFEEAERDWVFVVDSDDWLKADCIKTIKGFIKDAHPNVDAISTLISYSDGEIVGSKFPVGIDNYCDQIEKGVYGDKADIFRKSVITGFKFPAFSGENFMAESPMYIWFGQNYKTDFYNYSGYICEYQKDGLSDNSVINRHRCYRSTLYVYENQYLNFKSTGLKGKAAINWWRFRIIKRYNVRNKIPICYLLFGFFLFFKDLFNHGKIILSKST